MNKNLFEEYNSNPERILSEVNQYLENRQWEIYDSLVGFANPVVSKNPYTSQFLNYYLNNNDVNITFLDLLKTTFYYILHSLKMILIESAFIVLFKKNKKVNSTYRPMLISFFNYDKKELSLFDELYLPGFQKELSEKKIEYSYVPKSVRFPNNPIKAKRAFKELKKQNSSLFSHYEYIKRWEIIYLFYWSLAYFIKGLKSIKPFSKNKLDRYYNKAFVETLKYSKINIFLYYLSTKNYLKRNATKKVVLWYENQDIDKCIIKAIRDSEKQIEIIGCQFFLITPRICFLSPSEYEIKNNLLPNSIFTMQLEPVNKKIPERYKIGKGLRYLYLQNYNVLEIPMGEKDYFTVFLTIFKDKNKIAFNLLNNSFLRNSSLFFINHPGLMNEPIPKNSKWKVVNDKQVDLLLKSDLVFITETGLLYEAIALGRQVIILGSNDSANNMIPPLKYQNKLWKLVTRPDELAESMTILRKYKMENELEFRQLAQDIKSEYFQNSPDSITNLFGF